jgi:NAD(P)-dependent dehydrogenase (short-subunit alcohol dehydrogenase family)
MARLPTLFHIDLKLQLRTVLITGTSISGIGVETARTIAKHANLVIITGYSDERFGSLLAVQRLLFYFIFPRLELSEEAIKKDVPSANIRRLTLDLSGLAAVRKAAVEVNTYKESLHVRENNCPLPSKSLANNTTGAHE